MNSTLAAFSVPLGGTMLGPLPEVSSKNLSLKVPAGVKSFELRGICAVPSEKTLTSAHLNGPTIAQTVQMPVPNGFWMRADFPDVTSANTEVQIDLTGAPIVRFLHVRPRPTEMRTERFSPWPYHARELPATV
jgi:hypothetical protein